MSRYLVCSLLALLSLACAPLSPLVKDNNVGLSALNVHRLLAVGQWRLTGRLSVRGGGRSMLSRLEWRHDELSDLLVVSTSLGGVAGKIKSLQGVLLLTDASGNTRLIDHAELEGLLGYALPLQQLKFWVRGLADPSLPIKGVGMLSNGVREFEQQGWLVKLGRFVSVDGFTLPEKITVVKAGVKIKIVVEEWLI